MKVCPSCGAENDALADFCASCGDFLAWEAPTGSFVADRRAPGAAPAVAPPAATPPPPPATPPIDLAPPDQTPEPAAPMPAVADEPVWRDNVATDVVGDAAAEAERAATAERERLEAERAATAERERLDAERAAAAERERLEAGRAAWARERQAAEAAERERLAVEASARAERLSRLVAPGAPTAKPSTALPSAAAPPPPVADAPITRDVPAPPPSGPAQQPPDAPTPAPTLSTAPPAAASVTSPPATPRPAPRATAAGPVRKGADGSSSLASVITIAERSGRTDLSSRLKASREKIRRTGVTVAVVGEFKKGKSNLVNALVNADVCPSDPVNATVVPVEVGYAEDLTIVAEPVDAGAATTIAHGFEDVPDIASERGNLDNHLRLAHVVIGLPRRLLATGLTLVDTPGVGGLDSGAGALALAGLDAADGVLFVTDCSQELTAPEMRYLQAARERCDAVVCVMTKLDLYQEAVRLRDVNRAHLDAAGLADVPLVAVSSMLHLLALVEGNQQLEEESGFEELFGLLHREIWDPARRKGLAGAGLELASVAAHLTLPMEAELEAAASPEAAERTLARLAEQQDRLRQFRAGAGRWQQRLNEGIQDVLGDLDHDLRNRTRVVSKTADGMADSDDPTDDLVFEAWLHKAATEAVIGHYESITARTSALADEIAQVFVAFDRDAGIQVQALAPAELLAAIHVPREQNPNSDGIIRRLVTTTQGFNSGMVLASSMLGLIGTSVAVMAFIPLVTVPAAGYMARRAFTDDKTRRRAMRSAELKRLAGRYLDEITFVVQKHSRDTIRHTHREIRDHFIERMEQLERTLQQAVAAAEGARAKTAAGQDTLDTEAGAMEATIRQLRGTADRLVAVGALAS